MVGAGHVRASVHVEYDLSTSEDTEEVYDPKATATLTQQKSEENAGGGGPAGVPGTTSNVPGGAAAATAAAVAAGAETQSSRSESATFAAIRLILPGGWEVCRTLRLTAKVALSERED